MKNQFRVKCLVVLMSFMFLSSVKLSAQVKVYEGKEIIPTYKIGEPEVSPIFYTGRRVQGAEGRVYPYPAQFKLSDSLVDVSYDMVYLENEYMIVKILPAFGGRLFSAIDKTNGHELFHTNSVIKPDLIGTLGGWVSGGIEWCFPHHHRTSTFMKSDYRLVENEDGSATVWIGETEKTIRIRGIVGITLRPGKSYIEADYRINNTNSLTTSFLFWANVAITSDENFRTFWPPSHEIAVFHNNMSFVKWPISNKSEIYGRTSYDEGVDLTWWKNHPNPVSFFMWDAKEGFIGGYDYGVKAGTIHVGDPNKNNASKLWQFGPGLEGQNARRKLTDDGKAYVELMTGTYSNNQPDYNWILPHSVKEAKNYWYPLRDIEIVKNATIDASVTLQMRNPKTVFYGFNTTSEFKGATVQLKYGDQVLVEKTINIDPATPFSATFKSKKEFDEYKLSVVLKSKDGNDLVSYTPYKPLNPELPEEQEEVKKPEEIESVEDLYLAGRFVDQFNRPGLNPDDYFMAAIEKSPTDYRANLALGVRKIDQTKFEEGLKYLNVAADKLKIKYFQPKEGEIYYYMGLAQKELGKSEEAYRNFARATWYYQWFSAANFQLALMESEKGNLEKALELTEEAYSTNNSDGRIIVLYSALLRKLGKTEKALELIDGLIAYDPINFSALYEKHLLEPNEPFEKWHNNMQEVENNYIEIAINYLNAGLSEDGIKLLSSLEDVSNPLANYYLAWFYSQKGDEAKAKETALLAKNMSLDYCFPYRKESEKVLKNAIRIDSQNVAAYYLLGNLFYDNRPEDAIKSWEKAFEIDNSIPMVSRNLAFGSFYYEKNINKAIEHLKDALKGNPDNPVWYAELSKYYDASDLDNEDCLKILDENIDIAKQDVLAPKTYVELLNLNGEYDKALDFLGKHHFRTWEGGRETYWYYVNSQILKANQLSEGGDYKNAIEHLELALLYPENLEVGKPSGDEKNAMIYYFMGQTYDLQGNDKKAKEFYQKSASTENSWGMYDLIYFQAESYKKLGENHKAEEMFKELIVLGKKLQEKGSLNTMVEVEEGASNENKLISYSIYIEGLGNRGLGNTEKAQELFEEAVNIYKNNLWANFMMNK